MQRDDAREGGAATAATHEARLAFLADATRDLASTLDLDRTLWIVARLAVPVLADFCFFDLLDAAGKLRRVAWAHRDEAKLPLLAATGRFLERLDAAGHPSLLAIRTGEPHLVPELDLPEPAVFTSDPEHARLVASLGARSCLTVPVPGRERPIGALSFLYTDASGRHYGPEDVPLGLELASRASVAVQNARLVDALERANARNAESLEERQALLAREREARGRAEDALARLASVQAITDATVSRMRLDDLLRELLERVRNALSADTGTILLRQEGSEDVLVPRASIGLDAEHDDETRIPLGRGIAGRIAASRAPLIVPDLEAVEVWSPSLRERVRSLVGVPLVVGEKVIGVVHVGAAAPRRFAADDVELLELVAQRVSSAIERTRVAEKQDRLVEELRATARERQEALNRLAALQEIDRAILRAQSVHELARDALWRLAAIVPCSAGFLVVNDGDEAVVRAETPAERIGFREQTVVREGSVLGAHPPAEVVFADELARHEPRTEAIANLLEQGVTSLVCTPLLTRGERVGEVVLLSLGEPVRRAYAPTIEAVANQLAIALLQTRFREQLERHAEDLERRVVERTRDLTEANEALEAFGYTVAHDLRAPLRGMRGFAEALIEDFGPALEATAHGYADHIVRAAERMDRLIQDLLTYSRLSRADLTLGPVALGPVVADARRLVEATEGVTVEEPLPVVRAHGPTLVQVVANLLSNAVKFVEPGARPRVTVRAESRPPLARLWVEDEGIGVGAADRDRIFRVFERLHGVESYPGTGIGLAIVRKAMERLGGSSGMEPREPRGSRFWIELPLEPSLAEKPSVAAQEPRS